MPGKIMSPSTGTRENREFATEIKFLISPALAEQIRAWARARLSPDPNACGERSDGYQITSLYFDTGQFDVFHRRGSFGRSKYRIRRYGQSEVAFLERKLKTRGLLAKRRSVVQLSELEALSRGNAERGGDAYWFQRRLRARGLRPLCQISYRRTARVAMTQFGPIRLTLDDDVRALLAPGLRFSDREGDLILEGKIILELKYRYELPALFKHLIGEFALIPRSFSKYRQSVAVLGLQSSLDSSLSENRIPEYA
jgi:hypothetical protein